SSMASRQVTPLPSWTMTPMQGNMVRDTLSLLIYQMSGRVGGQLNTFLSCSDKQESPARRETPGLLFCYYFLLIFFNSSASLDNPCLAFLGASRWLAFFNPFFSSASAFFCRCCW